MYICIYTYTHIYIHTYIYIHTHTVYILYMFVYIRFRVPSLFNLLLVMNFFRSFFLQDKVLCQICKF